MEIVMIMIKETRTLKHLNGIALTKEKSPGLYVIQLDCSQVSAS
jgi:hypothetical protein